METSLRYQVDSRAGLRIHAKERFPSNSHTHFLVSGELDTRYGSPNCFSASIRHSFPQLLDIVGIGVKYDKQEKLRYYGQGKSKFPITRDGLVSFNIKGTCHTDKDAKKQKYNAAAELSWSIMNFQKDQDVRFKVGYELVEKVPYFQIRENNWTVNADANGKWNVRFDL